jgi:lipopolysaccharide transport system ATP-binding protein
MSESVISVAGLSKDFLRFRHPGWRALNALGIPVPASRYDRFQALSDVSIEVTRGEKVALIGRNGAGKSTLLRLVAQQMKPDRGRVLTAGRVQALMELGTGFHPDFTGIENIRSALAYQGLSGKRVHECLEDVAEFSELDDFLVRPVKEYSSGMYARLAFAVATAITPEILIIDEVLGAGDAYFLGKCIQRMKALTSQGATILFVSHDMSSVQMLCDRAVWLEHGRVRQDGQLLPVTKAYLESIREEEEARVRAKSMSLTKRQAVRLGGTQATTTLIRLIDVDQRAPKDPMAVDAMRYGGRGIETVEITPSRSIDSAGPILDVTYMNWRLQDHLGKQAWLFGDFGGRYTHAPIQLAWPQGIPEDAWLEMSFAASQSASVNLDWYDEEAGGYRNLAVIGASREGERWQSLRVDLPKHGKERAAQEFLENLPQLESHDRYGSGSIRITGFGFFDDSGAQRHTLITRRPASAVLSFSASDEVHGAVPVIAIYRPDGSCALQAIATTEGIAFETLRGAGGIRVRFEPLYLGPGDYLVSVALFKHLDPASAIEPEAHDVHDRCYALKVLPPFGVGVELGIVNQPSLWERV